ncbi:MAG: ABC transporter permease subunit [Phycisphaerae bacterium]|jgi:ABC-type transport system involved in multi-copper enzyme maturation permease subunit
MGILRDIAKWLWRLLPGNPILVRVVAMGSKRTRHLWARLIYLVALFVVLLVAGTGMLQSAQGRSLAELAKNSTQTFIWVSLVQLFLMCFIAPVFCAGAITQEKDANTFHILLTTPMTNGQIVLGSLLSRIYFVWVLLLAGLPIFCITMIYGGVTTSEIFQSFGLAACTGLLTGSIAITISFLRIGTRRTIFAFFAGIAVYLLALAAIGLSPYGQLTEGTPGTNFLGTGLQRRMSWLAPVHPFLALFAVTGQTPAPSAADVYHYGWPWRWLLAQPQYGYMAVTTLASIIMVVLSLVFVRGGAREGETTFFTRIRDFFVRRRNGGELRRRPRRVWHNPIAWREAATRASAGGQSLVRWVFIIGGTAMGVVLAIAHYWSWAPFTATNPTTAREWLTVLVWIELAVVLLVVTNTAATTLTREKESLTIELLLSTPLTSQYIIAGMLRGLVSFALPLIAVPTATLTIFAVSGLITTGRYPEVITPESCLLAPLLMVAYTAMAAMVGLQFSLMSKKTVQAVMSSTAVVMGAAGLLWACGLAIMQAGPVTAAVILPFTPFPAMLTLTDFERAFDPLSQASTHVLASARVTRVLFSLASAGVYLAITYAVYKSMVRGFDMTVRRQSA